MESTQGAFLVIRLSSIGDIVHTLPAVAGLARAHPNREIHWVIEPRYAVLLQGNPYVAKTIELDTLGWAERPLARKTFFELARRVLDLRDYPYQAAIDFQGLMKSAIIARLSRAGERIGFSRRAAREPLAALLYTESVGVEGRRHVIEMNYALAERLGAQRHEWEFPLPCRAEVGDKVQFELDALGIEEFIIVNPGGGWRSKRWPPESYARLIGALERERGFTVLVTGSSSEAATIERILDSAGAGKARTFPSALDEYIALARKAKLFIGGDTGPLHIAAAVGTPIVALYNMNERRNTPARNGPFNPMDIVVTNLADGKAAAKDKGYLEGISVEQVLAAVNERLERANG